jgi:hypothetical protein
MIHGFPGRKTVEGRLEIHFQDDDRSSGAGMLDAFAGQILHLGAGIWNEITALLELKERGRYGGGIAGSSNDIGNASGTKELSPRFWSCHARGVDLERVGGVPIEVGNLQVIGVTEEDKGFARI